MSRPPEHKQVDRRTFLRRGLLAGGALAAGAAGLRLSSGEADPALPQIPAGAAGPVRVARAGGRKRPNILVIVVDQLRQPRWFEAAGPMRRWLPNISSLRRDGVSFSHHYTAANDCTPSRAALVTGLYTHQTGCLITGGSTLDPGFPTWGHMLREHGYDTNWFGKWHLTRGDNHWTEGHGDYEAYGFGGGTFPSPDGGPGQGWHTDPTIAAQFDDWFAAQGRQEPWCTTVSFVNPHDIAWWYGWSNRVPAEAYAPPVFGALPPNYETPQRMIAQAKPSLQRSLQDTAAFSFGSVPFEGPGTVAAWMPLLNLYLKLQRAVDFHVGQVLRTLAARPEVAANTVVVFTSDHGEYGASHGMRGKGASAYEEAINVPLIVRDPRGELTDAARIPRRQLSSSVDLAPLLLTIGSGSDAWRRDAHYSHLANRLDLAAILADPTAPGRDYVLHATDETVTEFALEPYAADAPLHVTAMRTASGKYATYSNWTPGANDIETAGQENELYDYGTAGGRLELDNVAPVSARQPDMDARLRAAIADELREPLPARLGPAYERGWADLAAVVGRVDAHAALFRARHDAVTQAEALARSRRRRGSRRPARA
jgi:arylsulfatase A-like enzyme